MPVYVEATADDTEARLLKGLRKRCPAAGRPRPDRHHRRPASRRGARATARRSFIVLDQFEQWLHARRAERIPNWPRPSGSATANMSSASSWCGMTSGSALTRFMGDLQIELVQGQNTALVDLFDPIHARKVLAEFGRAFGPAARRDRPESRTLSSIKPSRVCPRTGGSSPIRLALFAEMVKGKPWTPATLKEVGGTEGVGVTFLEETFSSRRPAPTPLTSRPPKPC